MHALQAQRDAAQGAQRQRSGPPQPAVRRLELPPDNPVLLAMRGRLDRCLDLVETRLGEANYFAGAEVTAADVMMVFSLTTMRHFLPLDLGPYPNILAYLQRIGARDAYRRAMQKGDPDMAPLLA